MSWGIGPMFSTCSIPSDLFGVPASCPESWVKRAAWFKAEPVAITEEQEDQGLLSCLYGDFQGGRDSPARWASSSCRWQWPSCLDPPFHLVDPPFPTEAVEVLDLIEGLRQH